MKTPLPKEELPKAVQDCHALLLWLIPLLDGFPRNRRFTLGEQLETRLLEVLQALVEASYTRDKIAPLNRANLDLEICRHLWRLAYELKLIPLRRYEHDARLMIELGRQIGGWLRGLLFGLPSEEKQFEGWDINFPGNRLKPADSPDRSPCCAAG